MLSAAPDLNETEARRVLGGFLFSGDDDHKLARVLSGGEDAARVGHPGGFGGQRAVAGRADQQPADPASRAEVLSTIQRYTLARSCWSPTTGGAVQALQPDRVIVLPDGVEDLWSEDYAELVALA